MTKLPARPPTRGASTTARSQAAATTNDRKGTTMRLAITLAAALAATLTLAVTAPGAGAAAPDHQTFSFSSDSIDTSCGFPVAVHAEFTNMIIDSSLLTGTGTLQLHQSDVETWTANGITLRVNDHYTIFVTTVDGIPQTATHVGVLDDIVGPNGDHLFFRTGQAVYQVVFDPDLGFYVDGALLTRHGVRDNFDGAKICAAFG